MSKWTFLATTSRGLEPFLALELKRLGAKDVEPVFSAVRFSGGLESAYRVALFSRIAHRVLYPLGSFEVHTPDHLTAGARRLPWKEHWDPESTLAVEFQSTDLGDAGIRHTHFGALKFKDGIVDAMAEQGMPRPRIDPVNPEFSIMVRLHRREASVSLDLTGASLHARGYRREGVQAPLRETLAAGLLEAAGWMNPSSESAPDVFVDAMCGSGTFGLEALWARLGVPPGLVSNAGKRGFLFSRWKKHNPKVWGGVLGEAQAALDQASARVEGLLKRGAGPFIHGRDEDREALESAAANVRAAERVTGLKLAPWIRFERAKLSAQTAPEASRGLWIANPPYGERLGSEEELIPLYEGIGDHLKKNYSGWTGWVLTGSDLLAKKIGLRAQTRHRVKNGPIECQFLSYSIRSGKFAD